MIHMGLSQAATLLDCSPLKSDVALTGITSDSRQIKPGMLFAALPGQTFDGHDYIQQAKDYGACAVLVAAVLTDRAERRATVSLRGGDLEIEYRDSGTVLMTGPAAEVFTATVDIDLGAATIS